MTRGCLNRFEVLLFSKNYGGCQKEMLEIHNVFLLQSDDTEQENFSFQGLLQRHGLYPTAIKM